MGEGPTIGVRREQGYATAAAGGKLHCHVTRPRERLFQRAVSGRMLAVDLNEVSFIDSAGLAALASRQAAAAHGASRQVVCAGPGPCSCSA